MCKTHCTVIAYRPFPSNIKITQVFTESQTGRQETTPMPTTCAVVGCHN